MTGVERCARCQNPPTNTVRYALRLPSGSTSTIVERLCWEHTRALRREHGRKVKVSTIAEEFR